MVREISAREAKARNGIYTLHHEMENHELRFRLKHSSGTAYIRTEAAADSGWQQSHYHKVVRETYIIESGWMALADLVNGTMRIRVFASGEVVTTEPGVVHNVYLPDGAIIHTVKHGGDEGDDRNTDGDAPAFNLLTRELHTEAEIRAEGYRHRNLVSYPEGYRHFDVLIWQVPAWSTAIFALACPLVLSATKLPSGGLAAQNVGGFIAFLSMCLFVFSVVLYRFRTHQHSLKAYIATPFWKSAQTWTQAAVSAQYSVLMATGLHLLWLNRGTAIAIGLVIGFGTWIGFEALIRRERVAVR